LSALVRLARVASSAGASPTTKPVAIASANVNTNTRASTPLSFHATSDSSDARITPPPANATPIAASPPPRTTSRVSTTSRRTTRGRPAPSANRTAISRRRRRARAMSKFATFAHVTRRTTTATPISQRETFPTSDGAPARLYQSGRTDATSRR
jgi:hypothetical protein